MSKKNQNLAHAQKRDCVPLKNTEEPKFLGNSFLEEEREPEHQAQLTNDTELKSTVT